MIFAAGLPIAQICTDMTASKVQKTNDFVTLANWSADYFLGLRNRYDGRNA